MMRYGQKQNSILNSPAVRALINPVRSSIPTPPPVASTSSSVDPSPVVKNPYLEVIDREERRARGEADEDGQDEGGRGSAAYLIPTQPADVKGKKRARDQDDVGDEAVVDHDERNGTRFGVVTRYREEDLPAELEKYWAQRYRLFSLFDDGCELDKEGWYSVTPENIAIQIAERCRSSVIVDAFCGVGGNAIQFAFTCERVIALDTSPVRLACARRNAEIYGVADRITFILADWVQWTRDYVERKKRGEVKAEDEIEVVFLSPPWGGIGYQTLGQAEATTTTTTTPTKKRPRLATLTDEVPATPTPQLSDGSGGGAPPAYPLSALAPLHGSALFALASQVTPHIAYYLPRNVDLLEVADLSPLKPGEPEGGKRERVEIEEEWMSGKLKAVTAYFGDLVVGAGNATGVDGDEDD
ncbi:hypothetical protein JCM10212_000071 [Sporobolomyces blumeae]